jgi:hypothetical protein
MAKAISEAVAVARLGRTELPEAVTRDRHYIYCPGCYADAKIRYPDTGEDYAVACAVHCFSTNVHQYNGDEEAPTLSPSLLVSYGLIEGGRYICHSFVKDGKIQFLGDCSHALAGQTVDLMDVPPVEK